MSVLLITYNLEVKGQNYEAILGVIEKYPHIKLSDSAYAIDITGKAERYLDIFNKIKPSLDKNDNLYVLTLESPKTGRGNKEINEWLEEHLP
jgi:hypothetical protein